LLREKKNVALKRNKPGGEKKKKARLPQTRKKTSLRATRRRSETGRGKRVKERQEETAVMVGSSRGTYNRPSIRNKT